MSQRTSQRSAAGPTFGEILESFRRRRGLNRRQLARQLGVPQAQVKDWERGVEIPIHPGLLRSLEVVLEMPEGLLSRAAGFAAPEPEEPRMTIRQSLDSLSEAQDESPEHPLDLEPEAPASAPQRVAFQGSPDGGTVVFSYRYNAPEERWVYRIRLLLTAAGVALMGLLLLWTSRRVWAELGVLWDAVFGP